MKKLIKIALLLASTTVIADHNIFHTTENIMIVPIIRVVDGDTIKTSISLPTPLNKLSIRVAGIDTPESTRRAKCDKEYELGKKAKAFLIEYLKDENAMVLKNFMYGTYAGRIVSDVYVNDVNIAELMIQNNYAVRYDGLNKPNWCD